MSNRAIVEGIIVDELDLDDEDNNEVSDESSLLDDYGADSLDVIQIVMELERQFGIDIDDEDAMQLRTVGDFVQYIDRRCGL